VLSFYHLKPHEALGLLTKTFWAMSSNIDRIQAQKDMRRLSTALAATSPDACIQYREALDKEMGDIVKTDGPPRDAQRDQAGFDELRAMAG
jgi:hypothetical protein